MKANEKRLMVNIDGLLIKEAHKAAIDRGIRFKAWIAEALQEKLNKIVAQ
jgi:predicted HicB family RNase H-like nuclease